MPPEEGIDYYYLPDGRMVLTDVFLLKRGFCCGKGCRHCPYEYKNVEEPRRTALMQERKEREQSGTR